MSEDLVVRPAKAMDMPSVAAVFAYYVRHTAITFELDPPSIDAWRQRLAELDTAGWPFLVGVLDDHVIGYGYVGPWRSKPAYRHTVENSVYLEPGHVGRGHGRRLLARLLLAAAAAGAREVVAVIADSGSDASIALHRTVGFADVGRLRAVGYKHGRWIDIHLLQKSLHPTDL